MGQLVRQWKKRTKSGSLLSAFLTAHPVLQETSGCTIKAEIDLLPSSVRVGTNNVLMVAALRIGFTETGRPAGNEFSSQHILSRWVRNMYLP